MHRKILIVAFLSSFYLVLFAQNELHFSHLGMEDGFTMDKANTIIQDEKGFIWIGTWNGLNRYDGYQCVTYQPSFHDTTTISNKEITTLMLDRENNLWIGTSNGLNCMDLRTGTLKKYEFNNRILSLLEDHKGVIWVGTWNGGLFKLDPLTEKVSHYLANDIVSDIYEDSRNILWVATYYGLVKFDSNSNEYIRHFPKSGQNSISHSVVTQITESNNGNLWVGTWGGGINRIEVRKDGNHLHFTHFRSGSGKGSLSSNVIYKLLYDQLGNLWVGTWDEGLNLLRPEQQMLSPENTRFLVYRKDLNNTGSLSGNGISSLFVDRSGVLWVGAEKIDRTSIIESGVKRYVLPKIQNDALKKINIRTFTDYQNQLWVGTNYSILQYEKDHEVYVLKTEYEEPSYRYGSTQFTAYSILDMLADSSGLWIGTEDAGLIHYEFTPDLKLDKQSERFLNQQTNPSLPGNKIGKLVPSKRYPGTIWIGTMQSGFAKLERNFEGEFSITKFGAGTGTDFISDNNIRAIFEASNGIVWIGTQNGLNRFDPETNKFQKYFYSSSDTNSINDNVINSILEDSSGNLWIGTNSGLNKRLIISQNNPNAGIHFKGFPVTNYLNNEFISNILEDETENLWIRLYRGFIKFDIQDEEIVGEFFSKDYENIQLERNTALKLDNGEFILGDQAGFITFTADSITEKSISPEVVIVDLQVFNKSIAGQDNTEDNYKLNPSVPYADRIKLSYKDKMLTFVFSAMDYKNPEKNNYHYKLEGFDDQWNVIGSQNTATYTNIPPGNYTFLVKATNSEGAWSEETATLAVVILPPWWKTTWAYLFYGLVIIGILYFFQKYSIIRAKEKSNLEFERMKTEEVKRLNELKSLFFTDITHELRTPLTLILGPARELLADKTLGGYAKKQAELIKNSAYKLLRLVNQLMEFYKLEKGVEDKPDICQIDTTALLREAYVFFKPMAESRNINFTINFEQDPIIAFFDPEKIEKIIFNLISNAFKYTHDRGEILISAKIEQKGNGKEEVIIKVEDNGVGIAKEYQEKVFERFFQINQVRTQSTGGIGLFLAKALIEQHGGMIILESEEGKGSCFTVSLPIDPALLKTRGVPFVRSEEEIEDIGQCEIEESINLSEKESDISNKPTVLVVEDDAELNDFLVTGLSSEFKVLSAYNGMEALEKAKKENPDLILTDIMMPGMDGFEFIRITRKDLNISHIPVVFLTAKTMQEDEIKGLKLGAVDYIYKPFNLVSVKLKIYNIFSSQKRFQERIRTEKILEPENIELSSLDEIFLRNAVDSVNNHLDDPSFDVEAFSSDLGVSPNQAYRKIKVLTGQTAKEFIRTQRLKIAANLLLQRKRSISEVIYMVGFTSPSYFARCFKKFYGCTPKEYMDKNS